MMGGNSAVRVLDSTACSIDSSASVLSVVKLELERNLVVAWLSVRFRVKGTWDDTLPRCRSDTCYGERKKSLKGLPLHLLL